MKEPTRWRTGMRLGVTALLATAALTAIPATFTPPALRSVAYAAETPTFSHSWPEYQGGITNTLSWIIYNNGDSTYSLSIKGYGEIPDSTSDSYRPWKYSPISIGNIKEIFFEPSGGDITYIGNYTFAGFNSVEKVTVPDGVLSIGDHAFEDCYSILDLNLPDSMDRIGNYAFNGCDCITNLEELKLPKSLKSLGDYAFFGLRSNTNLIIPNDIESIGIQALTRPSQLLQFGNSLPKMNDSFSPRTTGGDWGYVLDASHVDGVMTLDELDSIQSLLGTYDTLVLGGNYVGGVRDRAGMDHGQNIDVGARDVAITLTDSNDKKIASFTREGYTMKAYYVQSGNTTGVSKDEKNAWRKPNNFKDLAAYGLEKYTSYPGSIRSTMGYVEWIKIYDLEDYRGDKDKTEWTTPTPPTTEDIFTGWFKDPEFKEPVDKDQTTGKVYSEFTAVEDLFQFRGGSLRMNDTNPAVSTHMRFGYYFNQTSRMIYLLGEGKTGWDYWWTAPSGTVYRGSLFPEKLNYTNVGSNAFETNLVITNLPVSYYGTVITAKFTAAYETASGDVLTAVCPIEGSRSVRAVATAVKNSSKASSEQKEYCEKILAAAGVTNALSANE